MTSPILNIIHMIPTSKYQVQDARHIMNPYINSQNLNHDQTLSIQQIQNHLHLLIHQFIQNNPPNAHKSIDSRSKSKSDPFIYTGSAGNILVYLKLWEYYESDDQPQNAQSMKQSCIESLEIHIQLANLYETQVQINSPSFYLSPAGIFTMACLVYSKLNNQSQVYSNIQRLTKYYELCFTKDVCQEILYGLSGFLFCLLTIYKNVSLNDQTKLQLNQMIVKIVVQLYKIGENNQIDTQLLIYKWHNKIYIGAAHGIVGILYMMIRSIQIIGPNQFHPTISTKIQNTLYWLIKQSFKSGNLPSSFNSKSDNLIHFCHGAPGAVYLFISAHQLFQKQEYLEKALDLGENVWTRGLIFKGNGLCHGITGNIYSMLALSNYGQQQYKLRVYQFTMISISEQLKQIVINQDNGMRKVQGVPDSPYSLMEGIGGDIIFYSELLKSQETALFPGFQV